nr:MAG TPA: hypothetical protein [Caudoviricetes sp.]
MIFYCYTNNKSDSCLVVMISALIFITIGSFWIISKLIYKLGDFKDAR